MKSLKQYLPKEFVSEAADRFADPHDSISPISGSQAGQHPDPTMTENGNRELSVGDPVKIKGKVQFSGCSGKVVDFGQGKAFIVVDLGKDGKHSFHSSDVEFNDYAYDENEEHNDGDRELSNLLKLSGYGN